MCYKSILVCAFVLAIIVTSANSEIIYKYSPDFLYSQRWKSERNQLPNSQLKALEEHGILSNKIHLRKRNGRTKISTSFINCHGRAAFLRSADKSFLQKHSVIFFSETMLIENKHHLCLENKTNFHVHAEHPRRGRPIGGLEMYVSSYLQPDLISSDANHIAIEIRGTTIIGFYFNPSTDVDDIIEKVSQVLSTVKNPNKCVIGGDFNLNAYLVKSNNFVVFENFMNSHSFGLISDPDIPTFSNSNGLSTPDHIFASYQVTGTNSLVHNFAASDHFPISTTLHIPRYQVKNDELLNIPKKLILKV